VPQVIRDSKTPSGPVPISGLRGPVITDALARAFRDNGLTVRYVFTIDDFDPMDSQSMRQQVGMAEHMGKPFARIPSPDPAVASDFARYHATRFLATFDRIGIRPEELPLAPRPVRRGEARSRDRSRTPPRRDGPRDLCERVERAQGGRLAAGLGRLRAVRQDRHHSRDRL